MPVLSFKQIAVTSLVGFIVIAAIMQVAFRGESARLVKAQEISDVYNAIDIPGSKLRFVQNDWYSSLCVLGVFDQSGAVIAKAEVFKEEMRSIYTAIAEGNLRFRDQNRQNLLMAYHQKEIAALQTPRYDSGNIWNLQPDSVVSVPSQDEAYKAVAHASIQFYMNMVQITLEERMRAIERGLSSDPGLQNMADN